LIGIRSRWFSTYKMYTYVVSYGIYSIVDYTYEQFVIEAM
jgi:hypothetical protein